MGRRDPVATVIRLVLPYPLSANRYWRSFVPRGSKRAVTVVSDEAKAYKAQVAALARQQGMRIPLDGRLRIEIRLFPARPQDWAKRAQRNPDTWDDDVRCIDLDNARKVLYDALQGVAYIDDGMIRQDAGERCEPDEQGARVEVTIAPIKRAPVAPELFAAAG